MRKLTVVLGCLLLAACGGGEEPARREVLQFNAGQPGMIVDGKPVSRELLAAVARGRALSADDPAQHERVLRELLDYVLLAQAARREGAEADATFAADVEVARLQGVANAMLGWYARRHPISDEQLRTEYEAQVAKAGTSSYDFGQLLFDKEADAVAAAGELAAGKAFDKVADAWRAKAQQAQAYRGVHLAQLPSPELAQALQALKPGEATKVPIKTRFGYHLLGLVAVNPFTPPAFDQVKEELRRTLAARQNEAYVAGLREKSSVQDLNAPAGAPAQTTR